LRFLPVYIDHNGKETSAWSSALPSNGSISSLGKRTPHKLKLTREQVIAHEAFKIARSMAEEYTRSSLDGKRAENRGPT
jgi:hypothetical protein